MPSILVISGPHEGEYFPLGHGTVVAGRDEVCAIQIVDETISRRHLRIRYDRGRSRHLALDLESANGVYVNDHRLDGETALCDGDVLRLGRTELMFSVLDFIDGENAMEHYRRRGEHEKSTVITDREGQRD